MKLHRKYILTVQINDSGDTITVTDPITIEIDIRRNTFSSAGTGVFRIYNLNPRHRLMLIHELYDYVHYRQIVLQAGYADQKKLPVIFQGNVIQAYSWRERTNFVTEIQCYSGIYAIKNSKLQTTLDAGYDTRRAMLAVVQNMSRNNVSLGKIGNFSTDPNPRGITLSGDAWQTLQDMAGQDAQVYIDNEKVYVLQKDEYSPTQKQFLITSTTGLLETPRRNQNHLDIRILFQPQINIGDLVNIESGSLDIGLSTAETRVRANSQAIYNGVRAVIGVNHTGIISGAFSGRMETIVNAWAGIGLLKAA